jgi:hypothetical protein
MRDGRAIPGRFAFRRHTGAPAEARKGCGRRTPNDDVTHRDMTAQRWWRTEKET